MESTQCRSETLCLQSSRRIAASSKIIHKEASDGYNYLYLGLAHKNWVFQLAPGIIGWLRIGAFLDVSLLLSVLKVFTSFRAHGIFLVLQIVVVHLSFVEGIPIIQKAFDLFP